MVKSFIRGGQTSLHNFRMFVQIFKKFTFFFVTLFLVGIIFLFVEKTSGHDRYLMLKILEAQTKYIINSTNDNKIIFTDKNNLERHIPYHIFLQSIGAKEVKEKAKQTLLHSLLISTSIALTFAAISMLLLAKIGKHNRQNKYLRGAKLVTASEIKKIIPPSSYSGYKLANVPLIKGADKRHFLISGLPGTGKSVATKEILDQIRAKGQKAIVYDIDQAFVGKYFRKGKDIILNPLDNSCPNWNIWGECKDFSDYKRVAESLIPQESTSDPFWVHAARTVLASALERLQEQGKTDTELLLEYLFSSNTDGLQQLVKGTIAEPMTSDKVDKMALSILATLSTYCGSLSYLKHIDKGEDEEKTFSIKNWLQNSDDNSWLFISTTQDKKSVLAPLLSVWVDIAIQSILSMAPDDNRKVWFVIDEFASLHKLPSIIDLLVRSRKFGGCLWSCIQDESQVYSVYGDKDGKTLMRNFGTRVYFRTNEEAARRAADYFGMHEQLGTKEGFSYGAHEMRDGINISKDIKKEHIILPSEISNLPDLWAFLKMPGDVPIVKTKFLLPAKT